MSAVHMDSSSTTWLPVLPDFSASCTPPPPVPSSHHHSLLLPRAAPSSVHRRVAKRRPRPSRRLPTTYINADPASFRRMVHQVTGASDDSLSIPLPQPNNAAELLLTRPAPVRAAATLVNINTLLPTLDTSAFLLAGALSRTGTDASASSESTAPVLKTMEAGGACCNTTTGGAGFPTLDSWDQYHAPLF